MSDEHGVQKSSIDKAMSMSKCPADCGVVNLAVDFIWQIRDQHIEAGGALAHFVAARSHGDIERFS